MEKESGGEQSAAHGGENSMMHDADLADEEDVAGYRQRGSALILTIMMMMALGLLGLNTVNQHLNAALSLTRSEKQYLESWELAASSLNWGLSRRWTLQADENWQCVDEANAGGLAISMGSTATLRSCIKPGETEDRYLLRGEGKVQPEASPVYLYQLVSLEGANNSEQRLKPLLNGWLDFCPLKDEVKCNEIS
ncbi:YgdB family protein [Rouxiella sp. T17]|uniref:YgdB family protein n=1 Tax=Rouxiella sp. T17 TaxID=3085684 RepID=UPI002FC6A63B